MTEVVDPTFTTSDLVLFECLLGELRGPHWHDIGKDVGFGALDLYDAIAERVRKSIDESTGDTPWAPDEIDLAAMRVLTSSVLERHYAPEFETVTGHSFDEVEALRTKAVVTVRQRRGGAGSTSILVGDKRFQFPARIIRDRPGRSNLLIAVPDAVSWARVYTHVGDADRFRAAALAVLNDHARPEDRVIEFEAESYFDLDRLAVSTARQAEAPSLGT